MTLCAVLKHASFFYTPLYIVIPWFCLQHRKGCVCNPKVVVYVAQGILESMHCVQKLKRWGRLSNCRVLSITSTTDIARCVVSFDEWAF